jgi:tRNA(His) 5'-end guanylyltransferase
MDATYSYLRYANRLNQGGSNQPSFFSRLITKINSERLDYYIRLFRATRNLIHHFRLEEMEKLENIRQEKRMKGMFSVSPVNLLHRYKDIVKTPSGEYAFVYSYPNLSKEDNEKMTEILEPEQVSLYRSCGGLPD